MLFFSVYVIYINMMILRERGAIEFLHFTTYNYYPNNLQFIKFIIIIITSVHTV